MDVAGKILTLKTVYATLRCHTCGGEDVAAIRCPNGDPVKKSRILDRPPLMDSTELLEWWLSIDPQSEESRHHDLLSGEMESGDDDGGALLFAPISEKAKLVRNSDVVVCNQSCRIARESE